MALPLNATGINVSHLFFPDAHPGVGQFSLGAIVGLGALVAAIILFTIIGNILVIIAVLTSRALSPPQNLFLVSLAIADILVATLVMPFSLANELMGYWYFGTVWCDIYLALDVLFCTSSIVHLCAISLDRYWSVTKAVEYNLKRTPKRIKCILVVVWLISAMISFPPLISMDREPEDEMHPLCKLNDETWYILLSCVGSFFAPCLIMILVYVRIYQVAKRRTRSLSVRKEGAESASQAQEGVGRGTSIKAKEEKENGHCPSGQQTGTEMEDMELEESSTSEGKEQEKDRAAGGAGSGEDGRESGRASTSKKEKEVCKKDSYSKRSSRMSRSSNRSFVFSTRRKRRSDRMSKNKVSQAREKRFTFVLAVVMGVFVLCWFPFFFSYSLYGVCRQACEIPKPLFKFFFWIGYCNSSLNPVIYTIFNQDFRRAFKNIVCHRRKRTF